MPWWHCGVVSDTHGIVRAGLGIAEFFRLFPDDRGTERWLVSKRWPDGLVCTHYGSADVAVDRTFAAMHGRRLTYQQFTRSND